MNKVYRQYFYLVLTPAKGNGLNATVTKKEPTGLAVNQRLLKIFVEVPATLFEIPKLSANISVPENSYDIKPITAEMQETIKSAVKQATGVELTINIIEPEK